MSVLAAQINQVEAGLGLVSDKLARTVLVAPYDGVVISGDLSQLLGTPVEQGKVFLFHESHMPMLALGERAHELVEIRIGCERARRANDQRQRAGKQRQRRHHPPRRPQCFSDVHRYARSQRS